MIKKFLHILLACCTLLINMGCAMPTIKLRRVYVTENERSTENYKYGKIGHEKTVLLSQKKRDKSEKNSENIGNATYRAWGGPTEVNITILIERDSNQTQVMPQQMPSLWTTWQGSPKYCSAQKGILCDIQTEEGKLILTFNYDAFPVGWVPFYLALSPIGLGYTIPSSLRAVVQPWIFSFDMKKPVAYLQLPDDVAYDGSTELIRVQHTITPSVLYLSCKSGKCMLLDDQKHVVNKLVWKQEFFYNTKRLKQLFNEEKEKEKQRKREEAREEAEIERGHKRWLAEQKRICPALYDVLYIRGGQYTLDPINKIKTWRRWNEYGCSDWMREQLYH